MHLLHRALEVVVVVHVVEPTLAPQLCSEVQTSGYRVTQKENMIHPYGPHMLEIWIQNVRLGH